MQVGKSIQIYKYAGIFTHKIKRTIQKQRLRIVPHILNTCNKNGDNIVSVQNGLLIIEYRGA